MLWSIFKFAKMLVFKAPLINIETLLDMFDDRSIQKLVEILNTPLFNIETLLDVVFKVFYLF